MKKRTPVVDPWAEYGKPITFAGAALEPDPAPQVRQRSTIDELERILNSEEEKWIEILPNGSIKVRDMTDEDRGNLKPLTMRENLGGEYALA
jgi:hypothetical protein